MEIKTANKLKNTNNNNASNCINSQKTILFLGASPQQLAPIKYALRLGYRVITCDNRPQNPGHELAHASYNISTTDLDSVCNLAEKEKIDAVIAYGSDVGAPTSAWVSERLGLKGNSYNAVTTLTNKAAFRQFQKKGNYFIPKFLVLDREIINNKTELSTKVFSEISLPLIVKPVDASGSKGISRVHTQEQLSNAINLATKYSRSGDIIIEQLISYVGFQICGEGFLQDGKIIFHACADEHFVPEISPPIGESFPSSASDEQINQGIKELQKIFTELGMQRGPFNFDLLFLETGEIFVVEIGPRNGGNRMPEAIANAFGADMITATIQSAIGDNVALNKQWTRYSATYSVHSKKTGVLQSIEYDPKLKSHITDEQIFIRSGEKVQRFTQGGDMLGCLILSFDSHEQMLSIISHMDELVHVQVDEQKVN